MKIPVLVATVFAAALSAVAAPELLWETTGLVGPESVVFDSVRNEFYVSNMGTHGTDATPGDGFISRLGADGQLLELKWVTGFDNPKGLALVGGKLYAGDDQDLVAIDVAAGKVAQRYAPADGPGDFNDVTADAAGNVYVSSGRLGTLFRLHDGKFDAWHKLDRAKTGGLNGLKAEKDRLLLGGWSVRDAEGKEQLGHISFVTYSDQTLGRLGNQPICHVDGLEPDGKGGYVVSDWLTGDVLNVSADGVPTPVLKLVRGTADLTYLPATQLLVIPSMNENLVRAYRWAPGEK